MSSISHLGQDFIKWTLDDVIMMMIDGDQGMTGATLHTMLIYISLEEEDKEDSFDTFIETLCFSCIVHDDDFIISVVRLSLISRSEVNY